MSRGSPVNSHSRLLSVVFSFRNEEENLEELVTRLDAALGDIQHLRYEMVFVNDASVDRSYEILKGLSAKYPITIVTLSRRFGVGPALLAGMAHARGDAVVYLDADLQDPPELIPRLYAEYLAGSDVVHTRRTRRLGESPAKMAITRLAYRIINFASDIRLEQNVGDFKLLSRRAVDVVLSSGERDPYMRGLAVWVGFRQTIVDYERQPRHGGTTHFSIFSRGPRDEFFRGLTAYSVAPLYLVVLIGFLSILASFAFVFYALTIKLMDVGGQGIPTVIILQSLFHSVTVMCVGLVALYVARIYGEVRSRPRYVIESVKSADENTVAR